MNILQVKKCHLLIKKKVIEQANFTYYCLAKALEKSKTIEVQEKNKQRHLKSMGNNQLNIVVKKNF